MLTSFFGKSKPVHFIILGAFLFLASFFVFFAEPEPATEVGDILYHLLKTVVVAFGVVLLDFIVSKNHLTRQNAYAILFYTCFFILVKEIFLHSDLVWASFFLLLAQRRIISLRRDSNAEKKILDAALWITVASLFYFYSLLYFIPLWIAVIQKPNTSYKQMLIPIVGFLTVLLLNTTLQLLVTDSFHWFFEWKQDINFDFSLYNSYQVLLPATLIITLLLWSGLFRLMNAASVSLKERPAYYMLFIIAAVSLAVAILGPVKDGSEMVFLFPVTAVFCANYLEGVKNIYKEKDKIESWFKEILLWIVVLCSIFYLFQ